jgi:hypothetical protein
LSNTTHWSSLYVTSDGLPPRLFSPE